ncbi:type VII secretion protein EssA [Lactococcus garvieae]|uniref:type VII secretion protein EssA n=1 Tax=Lactococcus garvieae TaxID=1363 RepID=UPI00385455B7
MKKGKKMVLLIPFIFMLSSQVSVLGDSDGSLHLQSERLTNQSAGSADVSDFPIRAQLFSTSLEEKVQEKIKKETEVGRHTQKLDFNKKLENKHYTMNIQPVKSELFKDYEQTSVASSRKDREDKNTGVFVLLALAIPLMLLTGFAGRRFARRKRRG